MQNSGNKFLESFRRITSAGNYIPEIDGLRFVAIFWVVVWMHLPTMLDKHLFPAHNYIENAEIAGELKCKLST